MKKIGVSLLLGILLLGFTVGMSAAEPEPTAPATVQATADPAAVVAAAGEAVQPADPATEQPAEPEAVTLSLEQAIELALANNPDVTLAKLDRDKASVDLDLALDAARKIDTPSSYTEALTNDVTPKTAESGFKIASTVYEIKLNQIRMSTEKAYYDVLKAIRGVEIKEAALKRAEEQLRQAEVNFKVGTVARNDVLSAESQVAQARAELTAAKNQKENAEMTFNKTLGLDLFKPFKLSSQFSYQPLEVNLDQVIAEQRDNQLSVIKARENRNNQQLKLDCAGRYYSPNVYTYRLEKIALDKLEINYNQSIKEATLQIHQAYDTLMAAKDQVEMYNKAAEQAKESARLVNLRYQVGLATSLEATNASIAQSQAEDKALQAIYDYNLVKAKFKYNLFDSGM